MRNIKLEKIICLFDIIVVEEWADQTVGGGLGPHILR